jgi:hypothetical protein
MQMSHRRKTALASSAMVLASVLSSCGFDYATDRDYPPGVGANDRTGVVDILNANIVTDQSGRGVLIASLANNSVDKPASLTSVTSEQADVAAFAPIKIGPGVAVNLADGDNDALRITNPGTEFGQLAEAKESAEESADAHAGESAEEHAAHSESSPSAVPWDDQGAVVAGKYVRVTMQFDTKESTTVNVPVVRNCGYYANIPGVNPGPEHCPSGNDLKQESSH